MHYNSQKSTVASKRSETYRMLQEHGGYALERMLLF